MKRLLSIVFAVLVMLNCVIVVSGEESINDDDMQASETVNSPTTHPGLFQQENVETVPITGLEIAETVQGRTSSI